jgi:hypothetical protein
MVDSCQLRGQGLPARRCLVLSLVLGGGSRQGTWSFLGADSGCRLDCLDTCIIRYGKLFLPGNAYPWQGHHYI